jgi:hypothetical protein
MSPRAGLNAVEIRKHFYSSVFIIGAANEEGLTAGVGIAR